MPQLFYDCKIRYTISMDISYILATLGVSLAINILMFLVAFRLQSDKLTDISYSVTFAVIAVWAFTLSDRSAYHSVLLVLVFLWAVRLGSFLLYRILKNGKDKRFDDMRGNFFKFGRFWVAQAVTVWAVMIPSVLAASHQAALSTVAYVGMALWTVGLIIETIADVQKIQFKNNPANKGKWIESGIWRYSRHPNYFGEIVVWIGVYIVAATSLPFVQAAIGLISPLFIIVLLLFVSGIPILEKSADKRWGNDPAYKKYKKRTSLLIPLP